MTAPKCSVVLCTVNCLSNRVHLVHVGDVKNTSSTRLYISYGGVKRLGLIWVDGFTSRGRSTSHIAAEKHLEM